MNIPFSVQTQLGHRTIRKFKNQLLSKETIDLLLEVANRTATSNGMQNFSIIIIDDQNKKDAISDIANQKHLKEVPFFALFIVDTYRNYHIAMQEGVELEAFKDMDRFIQGFTDASLAAQNMVNAAESLGLGVNYFGSILNDPKKLIDVVGMPKLTMPVVGLGVGYPDQEPMLKPRIPLKNKVFYNTYLQCDNYKEALQEYDQALSEYYDLRDLTKPIGKFSDQLISKHTNVNPIRVKYMQIAKEQGYDLKLD